MLNASITKAPSRILTGGCGLVLLGLLSAAAFIGYVILTGYVDPSSLNSLSGVVGILTSLVFAVSGAGLVLCVLGSWLDKIVLTLGVESLWARIAPIFGVALSRSYVADRPPRLLR